MLYACECSCGTLLHPFVIRFASLMDDLIFLYQARHDIDEILIDVLRAERAAQNEDHGNIWFKTKYFVWVLSRHLKQCFAYWLSSERHFLLHAFCFWEKLCRFRI